MQKPLTFPHRMVFATTRKIHHFPRTVFQANFLDNGDSSATSHDFFQADFFVRYFHGRRVMIRPGHGASKKCLRNPVGSSQEVIKMSYGSPRVGSGVVQLKSHGSGRNRPDPTREKRSDP